ncbi:MAG: 50S ribosomal protein L11 methyltransferase, partial [Syntrophomonadaceae bacterium]|nr:50S ribosomal protein L11 methyltransferase [Syntrophomonadaceae bacterium]
LELLPVLAGAVHPGGYLLVSGIIGEREAEVAGALAASGLSLASRRQEQDWVGLCARRVA